MIQRPPDSVGMPPIMQAASPDIGYRMASAHSSAVSACAGIARPRALAWDSL